MRRRYRRRRRRMNSFFLLKREEKGVSPSWNEEDEKEKETVIFLQGEGDRQRIHVKAVSFFRI